MSLGRRRAPAITTALLLVAVLAGCGGGARTLPVLGWTAPPQVFRLRDLPNDRVTLTAVRNLSGHPVRLTAAALVVRDAAGHPLRSSAQFITAFAHGLYGAFQKPNPLPPGELQRLGLVITIPPHATAPLTVAWRLTPAAREPVTLDYGGSAGLTLPSAARLASR